MSTIKNIDQLSTRAERRAIIKELNESLKAAQRAEAEAYEKTESLLKRALKLFGIGKEKIN